MDELCPRLFLRSDFLWEIGYIGPALDRYSPESPKPAVVSDSGYEGLGNRVVLCFLARPDSPTKLYLFDGTRAWPLNQHEPMARDIIRDFLAVSPFRDEAEAGFTPNLNGKGQWFIPTHALSLVPSAHTIERLPWKVAVTYAKNPPF